MASISLTANPEMDMVAPGGTVRRAGADRRTQVLTSGFSDALPGLSSTWSRDESVCVERCGSKAPDHFTLLWGCGGPIGWRDGSDALHREFEEMLSSDALSYKISKRRIEQEAVKRRLAVRVAKERHLMRSRQRKSFLSALTRNEPGVVRRASVHFAKQAQQRRQSVPATHSSQGGPPPAMPPEEEGASDDLPDRAVEEQQELASVTGDSISDDELCEDAQDVSNEELLALLGGRAGHSTEEAFFSCSWRKAYPAYEHAAEVSCARKPRVVHTPAPPLSTKREDNRPVAPRVSAKSIHTETGRRPLTAEAALAFARGRRYMSANRSTQSHSAGAAGPADAGRKDTFWSPAFGTMMKRLDNNVQGAVWDARRQLEGAAFNQYKSVCRSGADSSYYLFSLNRDNAETTRSEIHKFEERLSALHKKS